LLAGLFGLVFVILVLLGGAAGWPEVMGQDLLEN